MNAKLLCVITKRKIMWKKMTTDKHLYPGNYALFVCELGLCVKHT